MHCCNYRLSPPARALGPGTGLLLLGAVTELEVLHPRHTHTHTLCPRNAARSDTHTHTYTVRGMQRAGGGANPEHARSVGGQPGGQAWYPALAQPQRPEMTACVGPRLGVRAAEPAERVSGGWCL